MSLKPQSTRAMVVCLAASAISALFGLAYTVILDGDKLFGAVAGAIIALPIVFFEVFIVHGRIGESLRRMPLWALTLISASVWISSIAAGILIFTPAILNIENFPSWYDEKRFVQDLIVSLVVVLLISLSVRILSLMGGRVLLNFLLGRYHRPLREQQVFMFVDFLDARGMSRRLGDLRAQSLISAVLFDIDASVIEFRGETHRYFGDELVVTWRFRAAVRDGRCVKCALAIIRQLDANARRYRDAYGEAPRLRIALHGGWVVASEIGDDRREIVYFGDTINTAARLRGLAKKIQRNLVISAVLLDEMPLPSGVRAEDMGAFTLSGKARSTPVYALHNVDESLADVALVS